MDREHIRDGRFPILFKAEVSGCLDPGSTSSLSRSQTKCVAQDLGTAAEIN
ncbi:hypothetical protein C8J43_1124 [Sphingomonas sp. PP-CE-1G-424]|nr:hypothetical protein C8J43_1124 [Sphingomonas sp. PP-CE-1G-424]